MERSWLYRVGLYAGITIFAGLMLAPSVASWTGKDDALPGFIKKTFTRRILLGLDLQGGLHLVYEVQVDKAISDKADRLAAEIEEKLRKDKKVTNVSVAHAGKGAASELVVTFTDPADEKKFDKEFMKAFKRDLFEDARDVSKGEITLKMDPDQIDELRDYAVRQGVETIRNRVDKMAVSEPTIIRKGTDIIVELPGLKPEDFEHVKKQIGRTAQLEFKIVDDGTPYMNKIIGTAQVKKDQYPGIEVGHGDWSEKDSGTPHEDPYLKAKDKAVLEKFFADLTGEDAVPSDHEIGYEEMSARDVEDDGGNVKQGDKWWRCYYLHRRAELTGEYIADADQGWDQQTGRPEVNVSFDRRGADLFEKVTGGNVGRKMAIILDDSVKSAPILETKIGGGRARITLGGMGDPFQMQEDAKDLVGVLRTGALPAPLKRTHETQVGPTLGRDQVDRAKLSMTIGSLAVIIFMLIYYRLSGLIANLAMALNIVYLLAILAGLQATLTLPGIAGVVLTVGMAVDANIIIYERIREELRAGKSPRGAVEAGFGKAFWTIFDAHVTNLVAGIVLYTYGTGPIRGFAVTLMAGIVCNLFTSVWLSRAMFDWLVNRKKTETLSI